MVVGNLFQQFYNMADSIVVGQLLGVNALAAVGGLVASVLRHLHPRPLSQDGHGVHEPHVLHLHDEVDSSAALVAAKAIAHLLIR